MISNREEDWGYGPSHWDDSISFETNSYSKSLPGTREHSYKDYYSTYHSKSYNDRLKKDNIKTYSSKAPNTNKTLPKKPSFMKKVIQGLLSLGEVDTNETLKVKNARINKIISECKNIYL